MIRLKARHDGEGWGYLEQVRNGTGFGSDLRTADAIAMSLWPSKGLHLHGYEVKSSRSDLMNDLKNPAKHEAFAKYCHFWWLVVGDSKIIKDGELPSGWGLMVPRGDALMIKVHAPLKINPEPISYQFLAALFRKITRTSYTENDISKLCQTEYTRGQESQKEHNKRAIDRLEGKIKDLKTAIEEFETASGVKMSLYNSGPIGEAVKLITSGGFRSLQFNFEALGELGEKLIKLGEEGKKISSNFEELKP